MQGHWQADEDSQQASSPPLSQRGDSSMQSEAFSDARPLMNGHADSMRQPKHGAGEDPLQPSQHSSSRSNGAADRGEAEVHVGDQELLGQQTLDFWLNLCICHTLIVEQDKDGGPSVFQVQRLPCESASLPDSSICAVPWYCLFINTPTLATKQQTQCRPQAAPSLWPGAHAVGHVRDNTLSCTWNDHETSREVTLPVQGPSPDEVALVDGGRQLGFEFVARDRTSITIRMLGDEVRAGLLLATRPCTQQCAPASCSSGHSCVRATSLVHGCMQPAIECTVACRLLGRR